MQVTCLRRNFLLDYWHRFLCKFGWIVDHANRELIDRSRNLVIPAITCPTTSFLIAPIFDEIDQCFRELLARYIDITEDKPEKEVDVPYRHIVTLFPGSQPFKERPRTIPLKYREAVKKKFAEMVKLGWFKKAESYFGSPIHITPKQNGSDFRIVFDFRKLNKLIVKDAYPIPHLRDFTRDLYGCRYFSNLDIQSAFFRIKVDENSQKYLGVLLETELYVCTRLPQGLANASSSFQYYITKCLEGISNVFVFVDDILLATKTKQEHLSCLEMIFQRFRQYNLPLNLEKSKICKESIAFLGHSVSVNGIVPLPGKVDAISKYPQPIMAKNLRSFLGMTSFYRRHVRNYSEVVFSLQQALNKSSNKNSVLTWSDDMIDSFERIKSELTTAVNLAHPVVTAKLSLQIDASEISMGGSMPTIH